MATVTNSYSISEGSGKETNHYEISLRGSGIRYKPGDSLGFYPINNIELVKQTIRKIKAKRSDCIILLLMSDAKYEILNNENYSAKKLLEEYILDEGLDINTTVSQKI